MKLIYSVLVSSLMVLASTCFAEEFTSENVNGTWVFTHMTMDGGPAIKLNEKVVFGDDGSYTQYLPTGDLRGTGTWEIVDNVLIYNDKNGQQNWELVSFEDGKLHVDHKGGEMYFEKQ